MNKKTTSPTVASLAAKVLTTASSSAMAKQLAGSALAQAAKGAQTGAHLESLAAKVLDSSKYSAQTKTLAGSVLAQSVKGR
ncbi:MAG: hypothetical protein ACRYG7_11980 [Janthinobacterium lividum]